MPVTQLELGLECLPARPGEWLAEEDGEGSWLYL